MNPMLQASDATAIATNRFHIAKRFTTDPLSRASAISPTGATRDFAMLRPRQSFTRIPSGDNRTPVPKTWTSSTYPAYFVVIVYTPSQTPSGASFRNFWQRPTKSFVGPSDGYLGESA